MAVRMPWRDMWGCGRGPVARRLAPQGRIAAGTLLLAACLTAPAGTMPGVVLIVLSTAAWTVLCGMPRRMVAGSGLLGLAMFLPYFLLTPLLLKGSWTEAMTAPWDVFLHGLAGIMITVSTVTTLDASGLRRGLLALPIPHIFSAILIQVVQQTSTLAAETGRVTAAMAVRGGSGGGKTLLRMLTALPRVWLPRIMGRAECVAEAMELRGYAETDLRGLGLEAAGTADAAAIVIIAAVMVTAAGLRLRII